MLPRNHPDRISVTFDDPSLVSNAGLLLPLTLAQRLGLGELVDSHLDLGDAPLTIALDSTVCETYGLDKEGARRHNYSGQRGYHPLVAVAAGTGEALMSRLRRGRANTARGAGHFLRETVSGGARRRGHRTTHRARRQRLLHPRHRQGMPQQRCPLLHNRPSASGPQRDDRGYTRDRLDPHTLLDGRRCRRGRDHLHTLWGKPDAEPVRLIVRRVRPTPGSQLALFASYSYHAFITDRGGDTLQLEADHRRHAEIENAIRDLKYGVGLNHMPSGRFTANAPRLSRLFSQRHRNVLRWIRA